MFPHQDFTMNNKSQKKLSILILNWRDIKHPLAGGAEISTHEHAKGWVRAGHTVTIFSSSFQDAKTREEIDGVRIIRKGSHYTVHLHAFIYYLTKLRGKIDLVIDEFHFIPFFSPLYIKKKKIAFIHETAEELWFKNNPFPINILGYRLEPLFFKLYKNMTFITVSKSTKKGLLKFGIKENNIVIVQNGVQKVVNKFEKEENPVIIYLGRLAKDKGVEDAIEAFSYLAKRAAKIKFWVVGKEEKKDYKKYLQKKAKDLKIEQKMIFFDYISDEKKFELLKKAWMIINPSIKEGWGLTVIEGASQGTPTVAYKTVGLSDSIIDGKTGLLVSLRKPEGLADKILFLLKHRTLYHRISQNAVEWSKSFSWDKSVKKSLELIKNI